MDDVIHNMTASDILLAREKKDKELQEWFSAMSPAEQQLTIQLMEWHFRGMIHGPTLGEP